MVLLAWFIGGLMAICGALSYGALARRFPESGGEYTFLSKTIHPVAGFLAGWISLLVGFTAPIAAAAHGLQAYVAGPLGVTMQPQWIGTTAIVVAALSHGVRLQTGVALQNIVVVLMLLVITAFVTAGALLMPPHSNAEIPVPITNDAGLAAFAVSLIWISFAYSGWNASVYIGGEIKHPERNLNRSLIIGTTLVTVIYLALNAVFLYAAPVSALVGRIEIGAIAAEAIGGAGLQNVVSVLIALALFTSVLSMIMAGPRVYARMAKDGLFPRLFAVKGEVPRAAVALQAGLAIIVLWNTKLAELLGYIGFTLGLSAAATVCGLLMLRLREGAARVPIPGYPYIPGMFILATLAAAAFMATLRPWEAGIGLVTIAMGLPLYSLIRNVRKRKCDP